MHKTTTILLAAILAAGAHAADVKRSVAARNIATVTFQSESLGEQRSFNVLLPLDYETSTSRYPVLYLLHGYSDDHTAWSYMTNLSGYAAERRVIVVMPDASRSFYVNSAADPRARFEDFIIKDLISYVDSHYRTIPLKRARAVAGLSMGGYGAVFLGLKHFKLFSAVGALSAVVGIAHETAPQGLAASPAIQALFGPVGSPERQERDPYALLERVPPAEMPLLYIACGGQDILIQQSRDFVQMLAGKKIPYQYREVSPRVHYWDFWDEQIDVFLDILARTGTFTTR